MSPDTYSKSRFSSNIRLELRSVERDDDDDDDDDNRNNNSTFVAT